MLRLAGIRPLVRAVGFGVRAPVHISRVYCSTNATPEQAKQAEAEEPDRLDQILKEISTKGISTPRVDKVPEYTENDVDEEPEDIEVPEREEARFFPTVGTAAEAYDKFYEKFPALEHTVNTEKLEKRQQFEQVYLANHVNEPKKVIKFKNIVTKNYRTVTRSWPMVRLDSFKYGNEHFLDEMYDEIKGKYTWDNHLAYPDGSINLFCGTSTKSSPLNVKGDPLAKTYDERQYENLNRVVRLSLNKQEADAKFPQRVPPSAEELADEEPDKPLPVPPAPRPAPRLDETEAEQDEREAREEREIEETFMKERAERQLLRRIERKKKMSWKEEVPEKESRVQREARWSREKYELFNRPWTTMMNQKRSTHDERVLFDPVTMVKVISYSAKGKMIERYYYRDELREDNMIIHHALFLEPGFDVRNRIVRALPGEEAFSIKNSSMPNDYDYDKPDFPSFPPTIEKNTNLVLDKLLPLREKRVSVDASTPSSTASVGEELRTDLLDDNTLPAYVKTDMTEGFKRMVENGRLRVFVNLTCEREDETKFYNDYVRSFAKAIARGKEEEYRLSKLADEGADIYEFTGMVEIGATNVFRYIKLNPTKGWIRFYVGQQDRSLANQMAADIAESIAGSKKSNAMTFPFVWKFSEYKLSPEDLAAVRSVKWPPSLVPPPTSAFQQGDGSPTDQLAQYFEDSYLKFGNLIRFRQDLTAPEDTLDNVKAKHLHNVDPDSTAYVHVPEPGPIDFTQFDDSSFVPSDPEARAKLDRQLRETIRRDAKQSLAEAKAEAYQNVMARHESFKSKVDDARKQLLDVNGYKVQLPHDLQSLDIATLATHKEQPQVALAQRFQQRGSAVVAFDASGLRVIQEYQGYRLKIARNVIRIIRVDNVATVRFYNPETGELLREENHSGEFYRPPRSRFDFDSESEKSSDSVRKDRFEDATDVGKAWEFVERSHDTLVRVYNGESEELEEGEDDVTAVLDAMGSFDGTNENVKKELGEIRDELLQDVLESKSQEKKE